MRCARCKTARYATRNLAVTLVLCLLMLVLLAYVLPLLAALRPQATVQALVLLPTRELAAQVTRVARRLAAGSPERLHVMALLDADASQTISWQEWSHACAVWLHDMGA